MWSVRKNIVVGFCVSLILAGAAGSIDGAHAFQDKDFSLRFPASLSRFSPYADVAAMGGACAGSKWQSSLNPGATDWLDVEGARGISLNPQYSAIMFQEDTVLHVVAGSVTAGLEGAGTVQVAVAQVRSNERMTRDGLRFSTDINLVQVQWGKRFTDDFALGANVNYSASDLSYKIDSLQLAESSSDTYGIRAGVLYRLAENLLGGLVVEYAESPSKTIIYDVFGLGFGSLHEKDRTDQFILRVGPSWEYRRDSQISLDYSYASFRNTTGKLEVHRLYAGIDHRVVNPLFVRAGFAYDDDGNSSWTCGLGIYPHERIGIDLGYQNNMFPEIAPEFGRSHLATMSISILF